MTQLIKKNEIDHEYEKKNTYYIHVNPLKVSKDRRNVNAIVTFNDQLSPYLKNNFFHNLYEKLNTKPDRTFKTSDFTFLFADRDKDKYKYESLKNDLLSNLKSKLDEIKSFDSRTKELEHQIKSLSNETEQVQQVIKNLKSNHDDISKNIEKKEYQIPQYEINPDLNIIISDYIEIQGMTENFKTLEHRKKDYITKRNRLETQKNLNLEEQKKLAEDIHDKIKSIEEYKKVISMAETQIELKYDEINHSDVDVNDKIKSITSIKYKIKTLKDSKNSYNECKKLCENEEKTKNRIQQDLELEKKKFDANNFDVDIADIDKNLSNIEKELENIKKNFDTEINRIESNQKNNQYTETNLITHNLPKENGLYICNDYSIQKVINYIQRLKNIDTLKTVINEQKQKLNQVYTQIKDKEKSLESLRNTIDKLNSDKKSLQADLDRAKNEPWQ